MIVLSDLAFTVYDFYISSCFTVDFCDN